jgi:hypothetical protein
VSKKSATTRRAAATDAIGAGAAGSGIGTTIAAIANGLPSTSSYKSILLVSAPLIAVGITGLWLFIRNVYINPYTERRIKQEKIKAMNKLILDAENHAEKVRLDKNSSDFYKREVQETVEFLHRMRLNKMQDLIKIIDLS